MKQTKVTISKDFVRELSVSSDILLCLQVTSVLSSKNSKVLLPRLQSKIISQRNRAKKKEAGGQAGSLTD